MSEEARSKRRSVQLPPALGTPNTVQADDAPVEAVRAIAALLGRAALPAGSSRSGEMEESMSSDAEPLRGDRERPISGSVATLSDAAEDAVRDARRRQKRAWKHVQDVLERLSSDAPDGLST
jgi:hypothetical protein